MSSQVGLHRDYMTDLELVERQHPMDFLLLRRCSLRPANMSERCDRSMDVHQYPHILQVYTASCLFPAVSQLLDSFNSFPEIWMIWRWCR